MKKYIKRSRTGTGYMRDLSQSVNKACDAFFKRKGISNGNWKNRKKSSYEKEKQ
tara:strand:+ start:189 stop:350 length:162 start_codon:yes stop_codon:yes gene_type:complete